MNIDLDIVLVVALNLIFLTRDAASKEQIEMRTLGPAWPLGG
jgi:hypothetical protein